MATNSTEDSAVSEVREKGAQLVSAAQAQVGEKADHVRGEAVIQIRDQVEQRATQVGEQVQAVGQALKSGVDELRRDGKGTSAELVEKMAHRVDDLGDYLRSADPDRILGDLEDFARRRPWLSAGAAALAGFVASRVVKASSDRRYDAHGRSSGSYQGRGSLAPGAGR